MAFRKYPPLSRPTRKVQMLASQGQAPTTVIPRRRLGMYRGSVHVQQLGSFVGSPSGGGGGFQAAWAIGSNVVLQVGG